MPFNEHGIGPRGMWWAGMLGLVFSGGCLLSGGCIWDLRGDYVWSIGLENKLVLRRTLVETESSHVHDEFEFKPQVANWLFNGQTPKEETLDDLGIDGP